MSDIKRIGIIGAGLHGISALRRLSQNENFKIKCFERNFDLGGTWLYTDQIKEDIYGRPITSAIYHNLRTVTPGPLMEIDDYPLEKYGLPCFMTHQQVLQYLNWIVDDCDIRKLIKFNTEVKEVKPVDLSAKDTKWKITYGDIRHKNDLQTEEFDAVVVCNGNCSVPKYPDVENQEEFEGLLLHSMWYRRPENFVDLKVALLGCRYTGIDLAFELSKFAKKVYLCHNWTKAPTILPDNITEKRSSFKRFTKSSVILDNDDELDVDAVIYCTGYKHEFKFLPEGIVKIGKNSDVSNFFKYIFPAEWRTLFFMGIPRQVSFFKMSDHEALFIRSVLENKAKLPNDEEMQKIIEYDGANRRITCHNQFDWDKELAHYAGTFQPYPPVMKKVWDHYFNSWSNDFSNCKKNTYKVQGNESFSVE
ncbi:unnamed protein product [Mytilus edulis]|uniref:Flavin-containing monooxygenase n=1 Tax=Mytilus edulis TaxID=6550 RepID=A0A8S3TDY8_MYTED|nr:unnamed protein product [Mytilus edulis]